MTEIRIGYARCSTDRQDLAAQHEALVRLGVSPDRIYTDKGLTGSNRQRPGLDQTLAAVRDTQNKSLRWLITELSDTLKVSMDEIFRHPEVSYKVKTEAGTARW